MRFLIFLYSLEGGGTERVTVTTSRGWVEAGHHVAVATLASQTKDAYRLDPRVERIALGGDQLDPTIWGTLARNWQRFWAIRREIKRCRPDVVIGMSAMYNVAIGLAAVGLPCRTIGCNAGVPGPGRNQLSAAQELLRRYGYRLLDVVTSETQQVADWFSHRTWARRSVVIPKSVRWPVPAAAPELAPERWCKPGRQIVLAVGSFTPAKNFSSLLRIFATVCRSHPDWDLVILGDGPGRSTLETQVEELALQSRVFLPGWAGNVGAWYERASLFTLTSHYEGAPNVLIEALAYGLPAVSFDCDAGPRVFMRDTIDGFLVPPGDLEAFARTLARLMDDDELRKRLSERAVEARERFSEVRLMQAWDDLLATMGCPISRPGQTQ